MSDKAFAARSVTRLTVASWAAEQSGVPLRSRLGCEDLADQAAPGCGLDQMRAFHQKALLPAAGDLPVQLDRSDHPGRSFGEHRVLNRQPLGGVRQPLRRAR